MEDLKKNSAECGNMTGWTGIWIVPVTDVLGVYIRDERSRSVSLYSGGRFARIECTNIYLSDTAKDGARQLNITCSYRATPAQADYRLNDMMANRYLLKLRDRNGKLWLAGTQREPLRFGYEHVGESDGSGLHEYRLSFFRNLTTPLYALV